MTIKQITIACAMITMIHAILIETAIVGKGGGNAILNTVLRFFAAILTGLVLNLIIPGV
jgi:hypothetical protein